MVCSDKKCLYHSKPKLAKAYEDLDDVIMDEVIKK